MGASLITVNVDQPAHPVILVLSSYDAATWNVSVAAGTTVEVVIVSGYHASIVQGLPTGTKVLADFYDANDPRGNIATALTAQFPYFYAYIDDSEASYDMSYQDGAWRCSGNVSTYLSSNWKKSQDTVKKITGKEISGALGAYSGVSFAVGASTLGATLSPQRQGGYCYKNPDGTITRHP